MKRFLLWAAILLWTVPAIADGVTAYGGAVNNPSTKVKNLIRQTGLTFAKDFTVVPAGTLGDLTADYAEGGKTFGIAVDRSLYAATYIDSDGTIYGTTSSNVPRITKGYYSETGFVSAPGLMGESDGYNRALYSEDFTNAAWVKTNATVSGNTTDVVAPDKTSTVDTLTATSSNALILQTTAAPSAVVKRAFSVFLKRKTGTGNIDLTVDGSVYVAKTLSSTDWYRVYVTGNSANPTVGIRIATSGDAVYAWGAQLEDGVAAQKSNTARPNSYLKTTSGFAYRNIENIYYNYRIGNCPASELSVFLIGTYFYTGANNGGGATYSVRGYPFGGTVSIRFDARTADTGTDFYTEGLSTSYGTFGYPTYATKTYLTGIYDSDGSSGYTNRTYINNALKFSDVSTTFTPNAPTTTSLLTFGAGTSYGMHGILSNIAIFNGTKSLADVSTINTLLDQ